MKHGIDTETKGMGNLCQALQAVPGNECLIPEVISKVSSNLGRPMTSRELGDFLGIMVDIGQNLAENPDFLGKQKDPQMGNVVREFASNLLNIKAGEISLTLPSAMNSHCTRLMALATLNIGNACYEGSLPMQTYRNRQN